MGDPVTFLADLVRAGRAGEAAVQEAVAAALAALGCIIEKLVYRPADVALRHEFAGSTAMRSEERTAVVARLAGTGGGRSCILFAHPDSEPVPDAHGWSRDPFDPLKDGDRLIGWGVADDLSGVAAMVSGLREALSTGWRPAGDIVIASTPSKRHARGAAAVLERIARPDAAIYLHPAESGAGMAEIKACTPGLLDLRIALEGRAPDTAEPGHAAFAHLGLGTACIAGTVLYRLAALDRERGRRVRHGRIEGFVGRGTNLLVSAVSLGEPGRFNRLPVSGLIEASVSFPPGETLESVRAEVEAAIASLTLPAGWPEELRPRVEFTAGVTGAEVPADHPLFVAAAAAIAARTGQVARVNPVHTASDIRVPIVQHGIPTIGLGPLSGDLTQNGRTHEWVSIADHRRCVAAVADLLRDWCGQR